MGDSPLLARPLTKLCLGLGRQRFPASIPHPCQQQASEPPDPLLLLCAVKSSLSLSPSLCSCIKNCILPFRVASLDTNCSNLDAVADRLSAAFARSLAPPFPKDGCPFPSSRHPDSNAQTRFERRDVPRSKAANQKNCSSSSSSLFPRIACLPLRRLSASVAMASNGDKPARDVKNHLLFEIATEVAHRGKNDLSPAPPTPIPPLLTLASRWHLLRHQVQGARHHC